MRIGLLAPLIAPLRETQIGGAQALVCDLATALTARGHDVEVIAAQGSAVPGVTMVESGVDAAELEGSAYRSDGGGAGGAGRRTDDAYRRALGVARERDYAVLHNHAFDAAAIHHAGGAAPAVVHTLHLPPDAAVAAALALAGRRPHPPHVACVSAAQARAWEGLCAVETVLANGVPVAAIPWDERPGDAAVFAGRLSPEKGVDDAARIALGSGMRLEVYGDDYDPAFAADCRERWASSGAVVFRGPVSRRRLWRRLAGAAALLAPSGWEEPFGLAAAEAQAAGTPVVGYRRGGLSEVVAEGRSGFLVDPGDVAAGSAALLRVGREIGRADCRRHAERHLDIAATAAAHERLYARLAA
ncbi:MAG TPA: glycosyltransferase [Candidatus Dormibacteraeota bacterium]|nr:glycosyltransferase [Candidatus Dormibacteraeota bacterium]